MCGGGGGGGGGLLGWTQVNLVSIRIASRMYQIQWNLRTRGLRNAARLSTTAKLNGTDKAFPILLKPPRRANLSTRTKMPAPSLAVVRRFYCDTKHHCFDWCLREVVWLLVCGKFERHTYKAPEARCTATYIWIDFCTPRVRLWL